MQQLKIPIEIQETQVYQEQGNPIQGNIALCSNNINCSIIHHVHEIDLQFMGGLVLSDIPPLCLHGLSTMSDYCWKEKSLNLK